MKDIISIKDLCDIYKKELLLAIDERSIPGKNDPRLDLAILSLVDRLEVLEWVLADDDAPLISLHGDKVLH